MTVVTPTEISSMTAPSENFSIPVTAEFTEAAVKIQSLFRMLRVRKRVILPTNLFGYLTSHFQSSTREECIYLAMVIARKILLCIHSPEELKGSGKKIVIGEAEPYHNMTTKKVQAIFSPKVFWMHLNDKETRLRIQIYGFNKLGEGTYKTVKKSKTLIFNFCRNRTCQVAKTALIQTKNLIDKHDLIEAPLQDLLSWQEEDIQSVIDPLAVIHKLINCAEFNQDPEIRLKRIPKVIRGCISIEGLSYLEWEEERYISRDFLEACRAGTVKVSNDKSIPITLKDKVRIIRTMVHTCCALHKKGYVHRDVKGPNIFLKYEGEINGYLGDYDLLMNFGKDNVDTEYDFWDLCACKGMLIPTTDLYSCTLLLATVVFGSKAIDISKWRFNCNEYQEVFDMCEEMLKYAVKRRFVLLQDQLTKLSSWMENSKRIVIDKMHENSDLCYDSFNLRKLLSNMHVIYCNTSGQDFKDAITSFCIDIQILESTSKLFIDMLEADVKLHDHIRGLPRSYSTLEGYNKNQQLNYIRSLYLRFPIFNDLEERIRSIEKIVNSINYFSK